MGGYLQEVEEALKGERKLCQNERGFFARGHSQCEDYKGSIIVLCTGYVGLFVVVPPEPVDGEARDPVKLIAFQLAGYRDGDGTWSRFRLDIREKLMMADISVVI